MAFTKKLVVLLVAFSLLFSTAAFAEASVDLSSMSSEDLVALRAQINAELLSRGFEKDVDVPAGSYIIGKDIPSGDYTITTNNLVVITIMNEKGGYDDMYSITKNSPLGKITLKDGYSIEITGLVVFSPYKGLGF